MLDAASMLQIFPFLGMMMMMMRMWLKGNYVLYWDGHSLLWKVEAVGERLDHVMQAGQCQPTKVVPTIVVT